MRELFFKCIGAILVLYTGAAMGWRKGNAAMRRVQVLADICAFLGAVRDDLHFRCGRTGGNPRCGTAKYPAVGAAALFFRSRLRLRPSDRAGQCALPH